LSRAMSLIFFSSVLRIEVALDAAEG